MTPIATPDGDSPTDGGSDEPKRRARITTSHAEPAVVAGAVDPDNTDQMGTTLTADRVVTTIERMGTGGLQSTVDDYLVNLQIADDVAADATTGTPEDSESTHSQTNDATDANTNDT